jgi:chromosomal replication initiator protein
MFADGADLIDYLTQIPLPGQRRVSSPTDAASPRAKAVSPAFVVGPENRLVAATFGRLLDSVAPNATASIDRVNGTTPFAPRLLTLFGTSGTGKTHLAAGLVHHWQKKRGREAAEYIPASDFRRQYLAAVRTDSIVEFRRRIRSLQLLAIDDLHQLPADEHILQELRNTLDDFEERAATIVVTSNRPVATLAKLSADVRSRLAAGLLLQLAMPDTDARVRIIRQASSALGRPIADEIAQRLAAGVGGTATELIGTLLELSQAPAAIPLAAQAEHLLAARAARRPALQEIVAVVAKHSRLPQKLLKSDSRKQSAVFARALAIYLARELAGASYHEIGRALGGRDHTTIMHSYQKIEADRAANPPTQDVLDELRSKLTAY